MNAAALVVSILSSFFSSSAYAQAAAFPGAKPSEILESLRKGDESPAALSAAGPVAVSPEFPAARYPGDLSGRFDSAPDWSLTPGVLCTRGDKDFKEYRYFERVPYCRRNVSTEEKKTVSRWYGVPWEEHHKYQYDHLLSLCLGGSNNLKNLWPMPWDEARQKAKLENELCIRLREGRITQKAAVREELGWFAENMPAALDAFRALLGE